MRGHIVRCNTSGLGDTPRTRTLLYSLEAGQRTRPAEYYGAGPLGELAATRDALRRVEREVEADHAEQQRQAALTAPLDELSLLLDLLLKASLLEAGYHQHDRGAWRRQAMPQLKPTLPPGKTYPAELQTLLEKASQGDLSVLPELKKAFDENPELTRCSAIWSSTPSSRC